MVSVPVSAVIIISQAMTIAIPIPIPVSVPFTISISVSFPSSPIVPSIIPISLIISVPVKNRDKSAAIIIYRWLIQKTSIFTATTSKHNSQIKCTKDIKIHIAGKRNIFIITY